MINKNLLLIFILLFAMLRVNAQIKKTVCDCINPFTYGNKVASIQDNFENLFRNIPQWIDNPDSIQFLGYRYVGTVQSDRDIKKYFSGNYFNGGWDVAYSMVFDNEGGIDDVEIYSTKTRMPKESLNKLIEELSAPVQKGNSVYRIDFILDHVMLNHYVFIDPVSKQVVAGDVAFLVPRHHY